MLEELNLPNRVLWIKRFFMEPLVLERTFHEPFVHHVYSYSTITDAHVFSLCIYTFIINQQTVCKQLKIIWGETVNYVIMRQQHGLKTVEHV